jgi:hypothetical protein
MVNRFKARRVREALLLKLEMDSTLDYQKLRALLESMKAANPSLQFEIQCDDLGHFLRLNFATPNANGFFLFLETILLSVFFSGISQSARPVYGIDGTWLHTCYRHNMLIVTCLDAFNSIVVLGYSICSAENEDNYNSFFRFLGEHIPSLNREVSVIMSDRNPSLLKCAAVHFPLAHQSFCADHLKKNILNLLAKQHLMHKKERVTRLWFALVRQRSKETFKSLMHAMREEVFSFWTLLCLVRCGGRLYRSSYWLLQQMDPLCVWWRESCAHVLSHFQSIRRVSERSYFATAEQRNPGACDPNSHFELISKIIFVLFSSFLCFPFSFFIFVYLVLFFTITIHNNMNFC